MGTTSKNYSCTTQGLTTLTHINRSAQYTIVWNVLDYPSLVIPTGSHVDESLDVKKPALQFYNDLDKANYELCKFYFACMVDFFPASSFLFLLVSNLVSDEPAIFKDAPISIQVIGRTLEEEAVIRLGEIVDNALKAKIQVPKL